MNATYDGVVRLPCSLACDSKVMVTDLYLECMCRMQYACSSVQGWEGKEHVSVTALCPVRLYLLVRDDLAPVALPHRHARVGRAQVDACSRFFLISIYSAQFHLAHRCGTDAAAQMWRHGMRIVSSGAFCTDTPTNCWSCGHGAQTLPSLGLQAV